MKSENILPVVNPVVASNTEHGYLLAGVQTNESSKEWIMGNYMSQIYYSLRMGADMNFYPLMNHPLCPCIDYMRISCKMLEKKWDNIVEFLTEQIQEQYYIHIYLDWYYIEKSKAYGKMHLFHPTLVFGYNNVQRKFYVADFYVNDKFTFSEITYDAVEKACISSNEVDMPFMNERYFACLDVILYKNRSDFVYALDLDILKEALVNYLESVNLSKKMNCHDYEYFKTATFGINTIRNVYDLFDKELGQVNYKLFTVPSERTGLMVQRLQYLKEQKNIKIGWDIISRFEEIHEIYKRLIYLAVKYNLKSDRKIIKHMQGFILDVYSKEEKAFYQLINVL